MTSPTFEPVYPRAQIIEAVYRADVLRQGRPCVEYPGLHITLNGQKFDVTLGSKREPALEFTNFKEGFMLMSVVHLHCTFNLERLEIALDRMRRLMILDDLASL